MAIPNVHKQDILNALVFIDKNGVPEHHTSMTYDLVAENGKKYPPKYVIAVADHLANGTDISTEEFNSTPAVQFLKKEGFMIETRQKNFTLTVTADSITSTDDRFTMENLDLGDNYIPLDVYFQSAAGEMVRRSYNSNERKISNQTMPRIACQLYEQRIMALSPEEKASFPVCQYTPDSEVIRGIFPSVEKYIESRKHKTIEYLSYTCRNGQEVIIYSWNIFSTLLFTQECLRRFGQAGDRFVLTYQSKKGVTPPVLIDQYSATLLKSKNIIFHGAPGTGKTYLAHAIAANIISDGQTQVYDELSPEQQKQVAFVQFHPSYDYTDFVEGLRPTVNDDGSMGFELQDGVFKKFVDRARKNYDASRKTPVELGRDATVREAMNDFILSIEPGITKFQTMKGSEFFITDVDDRRICISIPGNASRNRLSLNMNRLMHMLESDKSFSNLRDIADLFGTARLQQEYSYYLAVYYEIIARKNALSSRPATVIQPEPPRKYIFIIDEINRGEISKIFGELFFAIDPGYRGMKSAIATQYANMHADPDEKFYIPENVYIIGTMNDIDRSVDSFDFAMRRRFRFIELKADEHTDMLDYLGGEKRSDAIARMTRLNRAISDTEGLGEHYHIGAAYFLKLEDLTFDQLWSDHLQPLLQDYVQGMYNEAVLMKDFEAAYKGTSDEVVAN